MRRIGTKPLIALLSTVVVFATTIDLVSSFAVVRQSLTTMDPSSKKKSTSVVINEDNSSSSSSKQAEDTAVVSFSHVQIYVDKLQDLAVYKSLENQLNEFAAVKKKQEMKDDAVMSLERQRELWQSLMTTESSPSFSFTPHGRDVVKQLLAGFGFRVTAARYPNQEEKVVPTINTRSVLVTSRDPQGVQILVTAIDDTTSQAAATAGAVDRDPMRLFDAENVCRFLQAHGNRQGIGVLGFYANNVELIRDRYQTLHPKLVADYDEAHKILEVYAFYKQHDNNDDETNNDRSADPGTILRFVQKSWSSSSTPPGLLPGLMPVPAIFDDDSSQPAYCDHWVSNVFSRTEFIDTLHDTLGFCPKVDFNAGVVAAGEAQIESTVTGNDAAVLLSDKDVALRDQSQVYLPINNALSSVGHVYGFLQELGQGIQHLASRVDNLVDFVQRGNDNRKIFGEGFTFLRIPRSYYGILTPRQLTEGIAGDGKGGVSEACANAIIEVMVSKSVLSNDGAVDLGVSREEIDGILENGLSGDHLEEYHGARDGALAVILRSRYKNMYSLLRDHLSEETYLGIVRNQILVDVQGEDLLYQIFTANILQRNVGDEAPFFEFIQRVCSECLDENGCPKKIRPGCGGFGIRNFLTLFLSIEVSKAMQEVSDAREAGDDERQKYAQQMVDYFTEQLNESNPILTEISDAMTEEGQCKERMAENMAAGNTKEAALWEAKMEAAAERKRNGNTKLMESSARYNALMKSLREKRNKV